MSSSSHLSPTFVLNGSSPFPSEFNSYLIELKKRRSSKQPKPKTPQMSCQRVNMSRAQTAATYRRRNREILVENFLNSCKSPQAATSFLPNHQRRPHTVPGPVSGQSSQQTLRRYQTAAETSGGLRPNSLHPRNVCGMNRLNEMMAYSQFRPVIPSYHQDTSEAWMATQSPHYRTQDLPIITEHELLERVRRNKKGTAIIAVDDLPNLREDNSLPAPVTSGSRVCTRLDNVPDNTSAPNTPEPCNWESTQYNLSPLRL